MTREPSVTVPHADLGARGVIDPEIQTILDMVAKARRPHYWEMTPQQARAWYAKAAPVLDLPPMPVHHIEDIPITRNDGSDLPARLYLPHAPSWIHPTPVLVFFHGGGFTVGSPDTVDAIVRKLCVQAQIAIVSVDYRLAPEHPFPAAFDDAWTAVRWVHGSGHEHGLDPERMAVGGDSAGGTLAAACAIAARDAGIRLALQVLLYPGTCAHQDTPSHFAYAEGMLLTRKTILWFFDQYVQRPQDRENWRFAPLLAESHAHLAPAWVAVAEFDPLVDEGVAYARALQAAGTRTTLTLYPGMVHAFLNMGGMVKMAVRALDDVAHALRRAFHLE